jgi:hypothetical protein
VTALRTIAAPSVEASLLAVWVATTSNVPFVAALVLFLVCRPGAALVANAVAHHYNPDSRPTTHPGNSPVSVMLAILRSLLTIGAIGAAAAAAWIWWHPAERFLTIYSHALMRCAAIGAVNAIAMEWEDNQPGGWLNP